MRWLDGIIDSMDMSLSKTLGDSEGQGSVVCYSPWGCKGLETTQQLNNKNKGKVFSQNIYIPKKNKEIIIIMSEKTKKDKRLEFIKISHCDLAFLGTC